ncbi:hypothetical protein ABE137_06895 [Brevibacillus laterosporus]|uniref:hypothetical protein n=1 Tax=Brevibacillus laterosporus TaxID=1465 RepID=UPI003D1D065E
MEKVKLDQEIVKQLDKIKEYGWSNKDIIKCRLEQNYNQIHLNRLNTINFDELVNALYMGYEVKFTPEELLLISYKEYEKSYLECNIQEAYSICQGIKLAVNVLGLSIKGINT